MNVLLGLLLVLIATALVANLLAADRFLAAMRHEAPRAWRQLGQPKALTKLGVRAHRDFREIMRNAELLEPAPRMLYWRRVYRASGAVGVVAFGLFFLALGWVVP